MTKSGRSSTGTLCLMVITLVFAALESAHAAPSLRSPGLLLTSGGPPSTVLTAVGGQTVVGIVTLAQPAPLGGINVQIGHDPGPVSTLSSVTVAAGQVQAKFKIATGPVRGSTPIKLRAVLGPMTETAVLTLIPVAVQSLAVETPAIGGKEVGGTVTLNAAAPPGGFEVALESQDVAVAAVPKSVMVDEGSTAAKFTVSTQPVDTDTSVVIAAGDPVAAKAELTVLAPTVFSVTLSNSAPIGGMPVAGTVTLSGAAPAGGFPVALKSSNPAGTVPPEIVVNQGLETAPFTVTTQPVTVDTSLNIYAGNSAATLTVKVPTVSTLGFPAATVFGGQTITGTITISGAAPGGGLQVPLASSNPNAAFVPSIVTIGGGLTSAEFPLSSSPVAVDTPVTITAGSGTSAKTTQMMVKGPPSVSSLEFEYAASVVGGGSLTATVVLSGAASTGGFTVPLSSSDPTHTSFPPDVVFGAGQTSASFTITTQPVSVDTNVTITAGKPGAAQTEQLTITAPILISLQLTFPTQSNFPTPFGAVTVAGGMELTATVMINGRASAGGFDVPLASDNSAASVVPMVKILEGQNSATLTIDTNTVTADTPVTISAGPLSSQKTLALMLLAPRVVSVSFDNPYVPGGSDITGRVMIDHYAPKSGLQLSLTSSQQPTNAPPQLLTIPVGTNQTSFIVPSIPVSVHTLVTITARMSLNDKSAQVMVTAPIVIALTLFDTNVTGGTSVNASLTLSGPAPAGGFDVPLESSDPVATVPSSVNVAPSQATAAFTVTTQPASTNIPVTITARTGPMATTASLIVNATPPP